jgi:hypothetical protein
MAFGTNWLMSFSVVWKSSFFKSFLCESDAIMVSLMDLTVTLSKKTTHSGSAKANGREPKTCLG